MRSGPKGLEASPDPFSPPTYAKASVGKPLAPEIQGLVRGTGVTEEFQREIISFFSDPARRGIGEKPLPRRIRIGGPAQRALRRPLPTERWGQGPFWPWSIFLCIASNGLILSRGDRF